MKKTLPILTLFICVFLFTKNFPERVTHHDDLAFQRSGYYQTVALNYATVASSILWIRTMVGFGEDLRVKKRNSKLIENGMVLAKLDSRFTPIYNWFPAAQINQIEGPKKKDFENIDALMDIGVRENDDPNLNYSAAMNHLGYNRNLNSEEKRHFYKIAANFLKPVLNHPKAHPRILSSYRYFKGGGHFRDKMDPKEEAEYLSSVLLSYEKDDEDQQSILLRLAALGYSDAAIDRKLAYQKEYEKKKNECCAYYSDDLSLAYGF